MNNDQFVPVKGKTGLYRDSNTTAIVNKDQTAYKSYISRKKVFRRKYLTRMGKKPYIVVCYLRYARVRLLQIVTIKALYHIGFSSYIVV